MQYDPELGKEIHRHLLSLNIESPMRWDKSPISCNTDDVRFGLDNVLEDLRLDLENDSLRETPARIAKMYCEEIFTGLDYANFPKCTTVDNGMQYDEMLATSCTVHSMCEHHFMPIMGTAWCAYLPAEKVLGLSKFNRVVEFFSRRPQVQERLTQQIVASLQYILGTENVAVVIKAKHLCTIFRGVRDIQSETISSSMGGKFRSVPALRAELLALTKGE